MGNNFIKECDTQQDCLEKIQEQCLDMSQTYMIESGLDLPVSNLIKPIIYLSWFTSTLLAIIIHFNQELHVHPLQLFKITCILQSAFFFTLMIGPEVCNMRLPFLYQNTLSLIQSGWDGPQGEYRAAQTLNASQTFTMSLYWYSNLYVNKLACMDLVRIIKSPFKKQGNYFAGFTPFRIFLTVLGFMFLFLAVIMVTYFHMITDGVASEIEAQINLCYFYMLLIGSIISICYVSSYFRASSFGIEVKRTIKRRHFVNLIGWLILNIFVCVAAIVQTNPIEITPTLRSILVILQGIFYSQGFLLPLLRVFEPDFFRIIYQKICLRMKEPTAKLKPLSVILKSDINSEFVYTILEGISQFSLLNNFGSGLTKDQMNRFRSMEYSVNKEGDTTVRIEKFMIEEKEEVEEEGGQKMESAVYTIKLDGVAKKTLRLKLGERQIEISQGQISII